jgi:hypothetical protein
VLIVQWKVQPFGGNFSFSLMVKAIKKAPLFKGGPKKMLNDAAI